MEYLKKSHKPIFILIGILFIGLQASFCAEIDRFEYITTDNGLSQNTVTSILCDSKGFLWFGTMNGLNRYDGYSFKIYQNTLSQSVELTNNRIVSIWEDKKQFIWFETYDGYYHCFNPQDESFSTLPKYMINLEEKYSKITCFFQYSDDEIWLGSSNSGVYRLLFDPAKGSYSQQQFLSRGQYSISNNDIRFIVADVDRNLYIGTKNGLNVLKRGDLVQGNFFFQHLYTGNSFTSAVSLGNDVWLGTQNSGLIYYSTSSRSFFTYSTTNSPLESNRIDLLRTSNEGKILVGGNSLYIIESRDKPWKKVPFDGSHVDKIFEDYKGLLWVTSGKYGVLQIDQSTGKSKHFDLTPKNYKYLSDKERPYFFEDSRKTLWICVHGGGLAQYQRESESFRFFRNDPRDPKSISSNTVMCIAEDKSGNLWVGTSLQGGVNKIIFKNPAFKSVQTNETFDDNMENVIRSVMEDRNGNIWAASKGGKITIFDTAMQAISPGLQYPFPSLGGLVYNVYSMFQDSRGYIWLGSKGAGLAVSTHPVNNTSSGFNTIDFYRYSNIENDTTSLCNDDIYCIDEDNSGRIWIGTYGGGLCCTKPVDYSTLTFATVNSQTSNLSNDMIRDILVDTENTLWVATTFGLNRASNISSQKDKVSFQVYYHDPQNPKSIAYNDVVHLFEDSGKRLWVGTFGGGAQMINKMQSEISVSNTYSVANGLSNNDVFGIEEDMMGHVWFSTENGLSRLNPKNQSFEIYNKSNGLTSNEFSENTCLRTQKGTLIFGNLNGIEIVQPERIMNYEIPLKVIFTNFQLFNKDANISVPNSPLKKSISFASKIDLKYFQSSFSFEFSALNYLDNSKTQYAYFLENFDRSWNYVGTEHKATYTNLRPGNYTFKVKAALWDGKWESEETSIQISINPPWWKTTYAFIAYLILFIVGSWYAMRIVFKVNSFRNELRVEKAVNEVKLQFFTNISHEIRTPLTLILGPIEDLLSDKKFPEEFKSALRLMQKNGKRMLHLLNQLLDFRKVQNKKMILKVSQVDIVAFTRDIYDNFKPFAQHNGVNLSFNQTVQPSDVWVDPHRIDSVIFNILSNALKFTPRGKSVDVSIDQDTKANEVLIKVADGGKGINEKDIPLLFARYSILSGESLYENSTGIGLSLSNEIVKMHGGEIRVSSGPGNGSLFTIVLKTGNAHLKGQTNIHFVDEHEGYTATYNLLKDNFSEIEPELGEKLANENGNHQHTLLIIEDNQQILSYLSEALSVDFSVILATDGKQGLELAGQHQPDLIVSDVMMPVIDGIEMTRQLKEDFSTCHIPVVLLTAKSSVDDQILGIESGAEAYVLKPFNMGVLRSIINNMLEQRKLILRKYRDNKEISPSDLKITSRDKEFIDKLVKYIEENYSDPELSITKLVDLSCVSRTVFYNKVKSLTGLSPIELMRQIKLKIAAQMLLNGYNVNEAAINIGFNDTRYFSKQFKELFGESPSTYKKEKTTDGDYN
jgi:signal transduction histidine kinase/ligand-binding sensor domain-containing protein/DNA-binding response OmpR family regulator